MKKKAFLLLLLPIVNILYSCQDNSAQTQTKSSQINQSAKTNVSAGLNPIQGQVKDVVITPNTLTLNEFQKANLKAIINLNNGGTDKNVIWQSDDFNVATVSSDGSVNAYNEGKTTITAISKDEPDKSATITVTVNKAGGSTANTTADKTNNTSVTVNPKTSSAPGTQTNLTKKQQSQLFAAPGAIKDQEKYDSSYYFPENNKTTTATKDSFVMVSPKDVNASDKPKTDVFVMAPPVASSTPRP